MIDKFLLSLPLSVMLAGAMSFPAQGAGETTPQCDARQAFVNLPIGVLDILPGVTRQDMLTYFEADSVWQAPNVMGGVSFLRKASPDYLDVQISEVSQLTIKRLPYKGGCIFMTVYTVGLDGAAPDSELKFYTSEMKVLPRDKFIKMPELADFLNVPKGNRNGTESLSDLEHLVAFPTYSFTVAQDDDLLKASLTVGDYMTKEDYEILKPYIRPEGVSYSWTGSRFRILNH